MDHGTSKANGRRRGIFKNSASGSWRHPIGDIFPRSSFENSHTFHTWTPIPILKVEAGTLKEIVCSWLAVRFEESWWADEAISYIGTRTCEGIDGLLSGRFMQS